MAELKIGLMGKKVEGWQLLLEQEGIPYVISPVDPSASEFSVLIICESSVESNVQFVQNYLSAGGAVLCSAKTFSGISGVKCVDVFIRYLIEEPNSQFSGVGLIDLSTKASLPQHANAMRTQNNRFAVFIGEYGGGKVIVLPFDAGGLLLDKRSTAKTFYTCHKRLPYENVSLVSKGNLFKLISRSLEILHHQRGLPYIHKWYYPNDLQTVFSWRIDTDYANQEEITKHYYLANEFAIPASWFVDVKNQQKFLDIFKEMVQQEIGIHCHEHETYADYTGNLQNIRKAVHVFEKNGLNAKGFAAPFGRWNDSLSKAIDELNFVYSSEFSYDYDNVPSFPYVNNKFTKALQMPVHPMSIGNLRGQGFDDKEMIEYFQSVLEKKISNREPLFLYYHPKNNHERVVRYIFNFVNQQNIKKVRMIDFAQWWTKRCSKKIDFKLEQNSLSIHGPVSQDDVWLHITKADGAETFTPIKSNIDLSELQWTKCPQPNPLPEDIRRVYKFNPWILLQKLENKTIGKIKHL